MAHEVRKLTVAGRYENIPVITRFVRETAESAGLSDKANYHCQMSVDEACTNVIEHAYQGAEDGDITVTCVIMEDRFQIEIVDQGQPFDPETVPEPQVAESIDDLKPGGIGLHLMRQLMDQVNFTFEEGLNRLVMVKQVQDGIPTRIAEFPVDPLENGIDVVLFHGRLNATTAPAVEEVFQTLFKQGHRWIVADMERVTYISSRGLKAFVSAWKQAREAGGDIVLAAMIPKVVMVFDTVGFSQLFEIYGTVDRAVNELSKTIESE